MYMTKGIRAVMVAMTVAGLGWVGLVAARPPAGTNTPMVTRPPGGTGTPTVTPPAGGAGAPTVTRPPGTFNWQGLVGEIIRPAQPDRGRPIIVNPPSRYPLRPTTPGGTRVIPEYQPDYLYPRPADTVITTPRVTVPVNEVVVKIPRLTPPLFGRLWDVSVREARCYAFQIQEMAARALTDAEAEFVKAGGDLKAVGKQLDQVRQLLGRGAPWREIEPILKAVFEQNHDGFNLRGRERFRRVVQFLLVRDGFVNVGNGAPRGRGKVLAPFGIPTGLIWVLYDPTLPAGVGLFVTDYIIVCGTGGKGELLLVRTSAAAGLGLPVGSGEPVPDMEAKDTIPAKDATVLRCDEAAGNTVNYLLNSSHRFTMQPGYKQELAGNHVWVVEFDRGGSQGTARYTLDKGWYEFRVKEGRWTLVKLNLEVIVDNREGTQDFQYLLENKIVTVKPGEVSKHESPTPLVVEFDRGTGPEDPARKNLNKSGTYKVAVDPDTNTWDLFTAQQSDVGSGGKPGESE